MLSDDGAVAKTPETLHLQVSRQSLAMWVCACARARSCACVRVMCMCAFVSVCVC